jgi:hypothetical protein
MLPATVALRSRWCVGLVGALCMALLAPASTRIGVRLDVR